MIYRKIAAALFDFDGVVMDTESQYSVFWDEKGKAYFPEIQNFGNIIKGQTLTQICDKYFPLDKEFQSKLVDDLDCFEANMKFEYIPGVVDFINDLKKNEVSIAIVTSSNDKKMNIVYRAHPELKELVDVILTADVFSKSKPDPDCFLQGASYFQADVKDCVVFEDSFHGLEAGRRAGMFVVGLATTNSREAIIDKANYVIDDFIGMNYDKMISLI